ncbi:hypothetical protein RQP46_001429 [Phenoliferia psychrophenolica]
MTPVLLVLTLLLPLTLAQSSNEWTHLSPATIEQLEAYEAEKADSTTISFFPVSTFVLWTNILSIFYTTVAFCLQMACMRMFVDHYTVTNIHCLKVAGTIIMTLYLFELTYRSVMRFQMLAHHFCTIFAIIFVIACLGVTDDPSLFVTALCWGFQASTEQIQFGGLLMYRFKCRPRAVSRTLRIGAVQALVAKMCSSIYVFIWWGMNQARHTHPTEIAFSVILVLAMSCLMVTQFYGSYVVWILSNSYEKKYFGVDGARPGDRDGAETPGSTQTQEKLLHDNRRSSISDFEYMSMEPPGQTERIKGLDTPDTLRLSEPETSREELSYSRISIAMPVPTLYDDIIYNIFDKLSEHYDHFALESEPQKQWKKRFMRQHFLPCCLTSKSFLVRARVHLYEEVSLDFKKGGYYHILQSESSKAQVLSIALNPHLGRLVRRIAINVAYPSHAEEYPLIPALLEKTLSAAPNVSELSMLVVYPVDHGEDEEEPPYLLSIFNIITNLGTSLRLLELEWSGTEDVEEDLVARSPALVSLLSSLPSLEHLTLKNLHIPPSSSTPSFLFRLKTLDLTGVEGTGSAAMFDSLVANSSGTLDSLRLPRDIKCDLSQLEALRNLAFQVDFSPLNNPDEDAEEDDEDDEDEAAARLTRAAVQDNVVPTIATTPSGVQTLEILDVNGYIPEDVFDGDFFATTVPRSISTITLIRLTVDADAVSRLLDGRPTAIPGSQVQQPQRFSKLVVVKNRGIVEGVVRGDKATLISRLHEAGVVFEGLE